MRDLFPDPLFPPAPRGLRGRARELRTLARTIETTAPARIALVGPGGSGKSMLAAALAHRASPLFEERKHWLRVGAWDYRTLLEMLALRFGTSRERSRIESSLRARLRRHRHLFVLDNHEDDRAIARLLDTFGDVGATFVITARRCLLGGVLVFPLTAPLVNEERPAFPRVASLTRRLRWSPLALDVADAIVASKASSVRALATHLDAQGIGRVRVIAHEDDLPEVGLLVDWAWQRLSPASRRMLGVLATVEGDHVDLASLGSLARVRSTEIEGAISALQRWHLVQEPLTGRFALHAVIRYAVQRRTTPEPDRIFSHYVGLLEEHPERVVIEQTHLFAAMDHAHRTSNLEGMLRVERLLTMLEQSSRPSRSTQSMR